MAPISATMVATSRRKTVDRRVSASLMNRKSVVKRWVSAAGLSRPICGKVRIDHVTVERRLHVGFDPRDHLVGEHRQAPTGRTP